MKGEGNKVYTVADDVSFANSKIFDDWVHVENPTQFEFNKSPRDEALKIIYEDNNYFFVNKPVGIASHGEPGERHAFIDHVQHHWRENILILGLPLNYYID
eukprot:UN31555